MLIAVAAPMLCPMSRSTGPGTCAVDAVDQRVDGERAVQSVAAVGGEVKGR